MNCEKLFDEFDRLTGTICGIRILQLQTHCPLIRWNGHRVVP